MSSENECVCVVCVPGSNAQYLSHTHTHISFFCVGPDIVRMSMGHQVSLLCIWTVHCIYLGNCTIFSLIYSVYYTHCAMHIGTVQFVHCTVHIYTVTVQSKDRLFKWYDSYHYIHIFSILFTVRLQHRNFKLQ